MWFLNSLLQTFVYSDLFLYTIKQNRWHKLTCPGGPPPRSGHQAVAVSQVSFKFSSWVNSFICKFYH